MKIVKFRNWEFSVDEIVTTAAYEKVNFGSVETCNCNDCKNFADNRERIYPTEFKCLLSDLGIDYRKEYDTWNYCTDEFGKHCYSGCFHFKGTFKGENCEIMINNKLKSKALTKISKDFSIGFMNGITASFFEDETELVQIEFDVKTDWTIAKELENE